MSLGIEEKNAVMRVMDSGVLSGFQGNWSDAFYGGEEIKALEKEWAEYFGVKHAIACNSATSGLWVACAAIGLQQNYKTINSKLAIGHYVGEYKPDEVIVTPYSMTCSASMPLHFGAKPIFADIERDYYCLDPDRVAEAITERTKAIIVVDLFGQPADYDKLNAIADRYGKKYGHKIYVIEDAAQAIGAKYKGRYAGTLGDIGVYSLNQFKHITCGEGGMVVSDNDELAFRLRLLINHAEAVSNDISMKDSTIPFLKGFEWTNIINLVGMNMRMTELQAAIAREQLKKLGGILERVRKHAEYFPVKVRPDCEHAFYRYTYQSHNAYSREWLEDWDKDSFYNNRFEQKRHYITPIYQMPLFKALGYDQHQCPVCEEVEKDIVLAWLKEI